MPTAIPPPEISISTRLKTFHTHARTPAPLSCIAVRWLHSGAPARASKAIAHSVAQEIRPRSRGSLPSRLGDAPPHPVLLRIMASVASAHSSPKSQGGWTQTTTNCATKSGSAQLCKTPRKNTDMGLCSRVVPRQGSGEFDPKHLMRDPTTTFTTQHCRGTFLLLPVYVVVSLIGLRAKLVHVLPERRRRSSCTSVSLPRSKRSVGWPTRACR